MDIDKYKAPVLIISGLISTMLFYLAFVLWFTAPERQNPDSCAYLSGKCL